MIRTQVYLTPHQKTKIALVSRQRRQAEAELIRELIDVGLAAVPTGASAGAALLSLAKLGDQLGVQGPADLSTKHDAYLYGDR